MKKEKRNETPKKEKKVHKREKKHHKEKDSDIEIKSTIESTTVAPYTVKLYPFDENSLRPPYFCMFYKTH
jgi:hypothetical protein